MKNVILKKMITLFLIVITVVISSKLLVAMNKVEGIDRNADEVLNYNVSLSINNKNEV